MSIFLTTGRGWIWILAASLFHVMAFIMLIVPISVWLAQKSRRVAMAFAIFGPLSLIFAGRVLGENLERFEAL